MGVNNVSAKQQIVQLALKKKGKAQTRPNPQLVYLSKNGSVFNAPGVKQPAPTNTRSTIQDLNTRESLDELNKKPITQVPGKDKGSQGQEGSGDVSLTNVKSSTSDTKSLTTQVKADAKTVTTLGASGAKLGKEIKTGNKAFIAKVQQQQQELKKENDRLTRIINQTEETQTLVANAQNELDSLTSGGTVDSSNSGRVGQLRQYIGSKVGLLQQNGKAIYSLQRSQARIMARMNRMNAQYIRVQHNNTKSIENQQNETNKVAEKAGEIEQYAAMTQAGGQALALLGDAMIAAGSIGGGFGAGLVSVGMVMKKVGTVAEMVGQYGQAAAGLTKTVAYAADGELCAAMMSAASAMQAGMSAAKSTAAIGQTFDAINEQGNAQIQNIAARSAAKEAVKDMTEEELGGVSKKQMRKMVQADIREQMNGKDATIKTSAKWGNSQLKDYKAQLQDGTKATLADGTKSTVVEKAKQDAQKTLDEVTKTIADREKLALDADNKLVKNDDKNYKVKDGKSKKISKVNKQIKNSFKAKISQKNKNITNPMANFGDTLSKLGNSATNIAAVFMQNEAAKGSTQRRQLEPFQMDARTRRIMERNQRYRQHATFV